MQKTNLKHKKIPGSAVWAALPGYLQLLGRLTPFGKPEFLLSAQTKLLDITGDFLERHAQFLLAVGRKIVGCIAGIRASAGLQRFASTSRCLEGD